MATWCKQGAAAAASFAAGLSLGLACVEEPRFVCTEEGERRLYERRIAPLLADARPSSCNACHLAGVDLGLYLRESPCQTMACMVHRGIVSLEEPESSLVLQWIERADPASPLVTETMIREEYEGMLEWIRFSAHCGELESCVSPDDPCGDPPTSFDCDIAFPDEPQPFDDPGDCSERTVEAMFAAKVYPWRGRCFPCHFVSESVDIEAPRWVEVGDCDVGSLATMRQVVARGLVNTEDPEQSLILLKPLSEEAGGVVHGGHDKIASKDEAAYRDLLAWIERFAACQW
jgi:hypothetical protein